MMNLSHQHSALISEEPGSQALALTAHTALRSLLGILAEYVLCCIIKDQRGSVSRPPAHRLLQSLPAGPQ